MQGATYVFFGIIGSGKGTQINFLSEYLKNKGVEPIRGATGDRFRQMMQKDGYTQSIIKGYMERGKLVPDFLANMIIADILTSSLSKEGVLITDGYPRTVSQSKVFEGMMEFYGRSDVKIIYIEVSREESMKRNLQRGRHDDTEDGIAKRFDEYVNNVIPAMEYFKDKKGYEILHINGEQSKDDVFKDIIKALNF